MTINTRRLSREEYLDSKKPQMMVLDFDYPSKFVMTKEDAETILGCLTRARAWVTNSYPKDPTIEAEIKFPSVEMLSVEEFKKLQMVNLITGNGK